MGNPNRSSGAIDERRRELLTAVAGGLAVGTIGATNTTATADDDTVTIVHDTHFHGRFQDSDYPELDIARYQTLIQDILAEYPNAGFFGNGDDLAPSVLGLEFEGEHMIEALNLMEPAVVGAGNHEFDFGVEVAEERFEESAFPWVIANLLTPDGEPVPGTERWTTVELGDHTVGVFGMGTTNFHDITDYPDDWQVLGYTEASEAAVDALTDAGADFIVCASHAPSVAHETIAAVDGVDAVVGSHSGIVFDEPDEHEGAIISEFGDEFDHLGRLTVDIETGELVDWERYDLYDSEAIDEEDTPESTDYHTPVDVQEIDRDPDVAALADEYITELEDRLGEPIVESEVELNASFDNYSIETGWGNLMADLMREVGDLDDEIDVAVQNAGGIRSDATYGPGEITGSDVMNILPFPNELEVWEITGEQLQEYLESAVRPMPDGFGAQPAIQVSGISFEWTGHFDETEVTNVYVGGELLDADDTYLVSTNDFEAGRSVISEGELVLQSGQFQGPYTMDKLEADHETIAPEREHRMIRVDEDVGEATLEEDEGVTATLSVPEAAESIVGESFRAVSRTGASVDAETVETDGDEVTVTFDDTIAELGDIDDPDVRIFGDFDPDEAYYDYESDGELVSLPANDMYDHYKLKAAVDTAEFEAIVGSADDEEADDEEPIDDDASDGLPGFTPAAGAAGVAGGAYLYSKYGGDDTPDGDE